jgi:hypothetical protein
MSWVLPEIVLQKVITHGIKELRRNKAAFYDIFAQYAEDELAQEYGTEYIDKLWLWFSTTKVPVVQAWSFNVQKVPCISVHLANETEDETKSAIGDYAGTFDDVSETGTGAFTVMLDLGIHANKAGDHVLWLYYIVSYILFRHKNMAERLGLKLHTFSASDYNKEAKYMTENIWTRWIRFRCTTQNFWSSDQEFLDIEEINIEPAVDNEPATDLSYGADVNIEDIDTTANKGIVASRIGDDDGIDDLNI